METAAAFPGRFSTRTSISPPGCRIDAIHGAPERIVLSGRNILALEAARHNTRGVAATAIPAVDLLFGAEALLAAAGEP
jgi:hypothetical protein